MAVRLARPLLEGPTLSLSSCFSFADFGLRPRGLPGLADDEADTLSAKDGPFYSNLSDGAVLTYL